MVTLLALPAPGAFGALGFTDPATLNTNAETDTGDDGGPQVTTDGLGNWVAAWQSSDELGMSAGADSDIFFARSFDPPFR